MELALHDQIEVMVQGLTIVVITAVTLSNIPGVLRAIAAIKMGRAMAIARKYSVRRETKQDTRRRQAELARYALRQAVGGTSRHRHLIY